MLTVREGTVQAGKKKHTAYIGYRRGSFCLRVYNVLHWLLPANYQEGFCWPVFLRNKQHGSQVLGIRCHQPQSHRASSTGEFSEGNMESSSCLCLWVNFFARATSTDAEERDPGCSPPEVASAAMACACSGPRQM